MQRPHRKRVQRHQRTEPPEGVDLAVVADEVPYVGSPEQKITPSFAGHPAPRSDASICDPSLANQRELVQSWLRDALRRGDCGGLWEGRFPRYVWRKANQEREEGVNPMPPSTSRKLGLMIRICLLTTVPLFCGMLFGCSTPSNVRTYPGPVLAADQVAVLSCVTTSAGFLGMGVGAADVVRIDGEKAPPSRSGKYELLPGPHRVEAGFSSAGLGSSSRVSKKSIELDFTAKAGEEYELRGKETATTQALIGLPGKWTAWITEKSSGQVIAGDPGK